MSDPQRYTTIALRAGLGGLNLGAIDQIPPEDWTRLTNVWRTQQGGWTSRVGQTAVTNAIGTQHHSIARLNNPQGATWTRIWGIDTSLYYGQSGALTVAEAGFSGDPLTFAEARPPFSGESWIYVADRTKLRKIRTDGLDLPIGMTPPAAACTAALAAELTVTVENFEAGFTGYAGTGGAPTLSYPAGKDTNALNILTAVGAAVSGYYNYADKALTVDLSTFGAVAASDDDLLHLWLKVDLPNSIMDVKVYFTVSAFTAGVLPGLSTTQNTDAYWKSFRASDFQTTIEQTQGPQSAAARLVTQELVDSGLREQEDDYRSGVAEIRVAQQDPARLSTQDTQQIVGRGVWTEYGVLGVPLRRGDFARIGNDTTLSWSTVTGIVIVVQTATAVAVNVSLDQSYLRGGRGLDTSEIGSTQYDWRVTNYDTRTGAEGNPSPIMATANFLDSLRRAVTVTPAAVYGDASVRQRVYRRGGSPVTTDDWYFVATNAADGGAVIDIVGDDSILTAGTLAIDNDQPVTTVNASGTTVLNQAIPNLFGPVDGYVFGLGDPYRPGHLYWSKRGNVDSWPATNLWEVCSPSEELLAGAVYGNQAYCWSRKRLYAIYPDSGEANQNITTATACRRGLLTRWSWCVGPDGLYALDAAGVYRTRGDVPDDLTDADLRPLFHGETVNGYAPIDLAVPLAIRLTVYDTELWVLYQDTGAVRQALILNLLTGKWRHYTFGRVLACAVTEETGTGQILLLGGNATGKSYSHTGLSDDTVAIAAVVRSASRSGPTPRADLQFGDLYALLDRQSTTITFTPYLNYEASSLTAVTVTSGSGMARTILDPFGTTPQHARSLAVDVRWSSATQRPILYEVGVSWVGQPDTTITRATDWDDLGTPAAKFVKGVSFECDTGGATKTVVVEATLDNGAVITLDTLTLTASGRRQVTSSWAGVYATLLRVRPTDTSEWQVWDLTWLTDLDVLGRLRLEVRPFDHGYPGVKTPLWISLVLRSTAVATLTLIVIDAAGNTFTDAYTIPSTGGLILPQYVSFAARKGYLIGYLLTCAVPLWVDPDQTQVAFQPWQGEPMQVPAFMLPDLRPMQETPA